MGARVDRLKDKSLTISETSGQKNVGILHEMARVWEKLESERWHQSVFMLVAYMLVRDVFALCGVVLCACVCVRVCVRV